ncbi:MAG: S-layer homology domain-containing protein [Clostridia bacterium]|nr:S-layer homology domain-containing protein [Clostridia bacterium]
MKRRILALLLCFLFISVPSLADYESELSAFPAAWQARLAALHETYPQWVFVAVPTELDWNEAVSAETGKKSLVEKHYSTFLRNTGEGHYNPETGRYTYHDASTWVSASGAMVDYFMNPANFLNEIYIFQFEALSYDETYHTQEGVELILKNTFMHQTPISYVTATGETVETEKTYSQVIMEAAQASGVSPYYLASKIRTEIGISPSGSVTGTYAGYPGIYNFYNIGANDGANPIANGLNWASLGNSYGRPWTTPEASIINGAVWIGELYISKGQDTMYFERFNVNPDSGYPLYSHQYMTNVYGAAGQALGTYQGYVAAGSLADSKVFYIPVFENMPVAETAVSFTGIEETRGVCNYGGSVNMRSGPSVLYDKCGSVPGGQTVTVLSAVRTDSEDRMHLLKNPYWYRIQCGGVTGYVSAEYIDLEPSVQLSAGETYALRPAADGGSGALYWENLGRNVLDVDARGVITAKKGGKAVVYAFTSGGGMAAVCVAVKGAFLDMEGHWAREVVEAVTDMGLFNGTSETAFSPELSMDRSMFITVLSRLYTEMGGKGDGNPALLPYLDVDVNVWYAKAVAWAYSGGILPFGTGSMFSPSAPVTRLEIAEAVYNLASYMALDTSANLEAGAAFSDFEDLSESEQQAMAWCVENGILRGMGDGTLGTEETATRAQVAQIVMNIYTALR